MTFADIIAKAKNIVRKVFVQHSNVIVGILHLLIECFICKSRFVGWLIFRNSGGDIFIDLLEHEQIFSKFFISNQANITIHLFNR